MVQTKKYLQFKAEFDLVFKMTACRQSQNCLTVCKPFIIG